MLKAVKRMDKNLAQPSRVTVINGCLAVILLALVPSSHAQESMATIGRGGSSNDEQSSQNIENSVLNDSFGSNRGGNVDPGAARGNNQGNLENGSDLFGNEGEEGFGAPIDDFQSSGSGNLGFGELEVDPAAAPVQQPARKAPGPSRVQAIAPNSVSAPPPTQAPVAAPVAPVVQPPPPTTAPVVAAPVSPAGATPPEALPPVAVPESVPFTPTPVAAEATAVPKAPTLPPANEFAGAPPIPGTRRIMAEGEAPDEYVVEPGDTLFDVCDQLIDEAGYWPKLWAMNPEIKNPHFIYPGMRLRFYPGDSSTPPFLQVLAEEDVVPVDKGELSEADLIAEPVAESAAVDLFGESGVFEVVDSSAIDVSQDVLDGIIVEGSIFSPQMIRLTVPTFVFGDERESLATVVAGKGGQILVGGTQEAVVDIDESLSPGTTYTALREVGGIDNPATGDFVGYRYDHVGSVQVVRLLGDDTALVKLSMSLLGLREGDILVPFVSTNRTVNTDEVGAAVDADSAVIGFELGGQILGGEGRYIVFDKTNAGGLTPGSYVRIYQRPDLLRSPRLEDIEGLQEPIGVARIIDSTDAGAVGYVIKSRNAIRIGDRTNGRG